MLADADVCGAGAGGGGVVRCTSADATADVGAAGAEGGAISMSPSSHSSHLSAVELASFSVVATLRSKVDVTTPVHSHKSQRKNASQQTHKT